MCNRFLTNRLGLSALRHVVLHLEPQCCARMSAPDFGHFAGDLSRLSCLQSLYNGLSGRLQPSNQNTFSLKLSALPNLKTVHMDSFWPHAIELPPGCAVHATFISHADQQHKGIWAGTRADVLHLRLPLKSAHFVRPADLPNPRVMADLLWPLQAQWTLDLVRISAPSLWLPGGGLGYRLRTYPGLMWADSVLMAGSECAMRLPGAQLP